MLKNLLIYRLIIVNSLGFCFLGFLYQLGFVEKALQRDPTFLVEGAFALFLVGVLSTFRRAWKVSQLWNKFKTGVLTKKENATKFLVKSSHIDDIPELIAYVGLLGTLLGLIEGLEGKALGDEEAVLAAIQIAGWTTSTATLFCMWTLILKRMLFTSSVLLLEDINEATDERG